MTKLPGHAYRTGGGKHNTGKKQCKLQLHSGRVRTGIEHLRWYHKIISVYGNPDIVALLIV
ncbi:MAG: hypothetical protein OIF47_15780 [Marinibacterium sp.]|nr:hypothetical protein [Marinibacterium sp.]